MDFNLIISLISGLVGGNIAGASLPEKNNLGVIGNSISGLIGGGAGGYLAQVLGLLAQAGIATGAAATTATGTAGGLDMASILASVGTGGVGGAVLMIVAGLIKNYTQNKS